MAKAVANLLVNVLSEAVVQRIQGVKGIHSTESQIRFASGADEVDSRPS